MAATLHVSAPVDEKTGTAISGSSVYICEDPTRPSNEPGACFTGTLIGTPPLDIPFCDTCTYKIGVMYTVVVRKTGYISANYHRTYVEGDAKTFSPALCSCTGPTSNFSSGCELVKHYDIDKDGVIMSDDCTTAILDALGESPKVTAREAFAVSEVYVNGGSINEMCPGCYEEVPRCFDTGVPPVPDSHASATFKGTIELANTCNAPVLVPKVKGTLTSYRFTNTDGVTVTKLNAGITYNIEITFGGFPYFTSVSVMDNDYGILRCVSYTNGGSHTDWIPAFAIIEGETKTVVFDSVPTGATVTVT